MAELQVVGKRLPRVDAAVKATGSAIFAADISVQGMLYGKILRSPFAHARILNIDTSKAERLPGVRAVITGKDFPGIKFGFLPFTRDQLPFALEKTRFVGEVVAAVAATDDDIAEEALELIRVDYEELPAVFTVEQAMKEGAPLVHDHAKGNVTFKANYNYGDVDKAFQGADYIREERLSSQRVNHGFIEPHSMLAQVDATGKVLMQGSKQSPYITWRHFCRAMDLPLNKVRLLNPYVGGAFSGKHDPHDLDFAAVKLAMKTGRPVKIVVSMDDILGAYRQRHSKEAWIKVGVKKDGTIVAIDAKLFSEGGAYACVSPLNLQIFGISLLEPYRISNARYEGTRFYTNKPPCGAMHGQSVPIARYVLESVLSAIADDLGIDQLEIRLRNAHKDGETTLSGKLLVNYVFTDTINKMSQAIDWQGWKAKKKPYRGMGFACTAVSSGTRVRGHWASAAVVKLTEDGTATVSHGGTELGQGCDTVMAQIAAESLGLKLEDITVATEDSDNTILEEGIFSSRTTVWAGNAVKAAAEDARDQLAEAAARVFKVDKGDIEFRDRRVFVRGNPDKGMSFGEMVREADFEQGRPIYGRGSWAGPVGHAHYDKVEGGMTPGAGSLTLAVEVEVDPETGKVKILNSVAVCDNGQPINPMMLEGQMEGGNLFQFGLAFSENCLTDEKGVPLTHDFLNYKIARATEAPHASLHSIITQNVFGPFGAKGGGESFCTAALAAAVNAVSDAIGVRMTDLPMTPDKVLKALEKKGAKG